MFNLFQRRDRAVRWMMSIILGMLCIGMCLYLIPGSGTYSSGGTDDSVVAQIGGDTLTAQEITQTIQRMTQSRQLPPDLLSIYAPQVIQQAISERIMAWKANEMGFRVSNDDADNAIIDSIPAQYVKNGKVDPAILAQVLQNQGVTLADFRADTARQLLISRLESVVSSGVVVSSAEVEKEYHQQNDKVKVQYAVLSGTDFAKETEPTDAEIQTFYNDNKQQFQVPDKRSLAVIVLDPAQIGAGIQVTDAQLHSEYQNRLSEFQTPERVQARHILLKTDGTNDAAMKTQAEDILKQIKGGADFAKLAKEKSQDPGSAVNGGELGWITRGQTVPEFEKAAFSLKVGETSDLVKTSYGYHIIQVEAHEQAHTQPFDDLKAQLTTDVQKQGAAKLMQDASDKAVTDLRKDPEHPQKAADDVHGTLINVENVQPNDPIPGIGVSKELFDAVSALKKDEVTLGPVVLQDGRALLAVVTNVTPAHQGTLDEVRADVKTKAQAQKTQKVVLAKANELVSKAQSMGGDLDKAAKAMNITLKTSNDVTRQDAIESVGTASGVPDIFTKPAGSVVGPASVTGGQFVGKILTQTPADPAGLAAQRQKITDDLHTQKARDRATFFEQGLRDALVASGKLKIHQDVIDRIIASYRRRS